jgi:endonuclease YncB( thermonuclease family)
MASRQLDCRGVTLRHWPSRLIYSFVALIAVGSVWTIGSATDHAQATPALVCASPEITDGDTLRCHGQRIRLIGIDAPEMPGSCRPGRQCVVGDPHAARAYLVSLTRTTVECRPQGQDRYGRTLARCSANGADLSCAMIQAGHAEPRYTALSCR